MVRLQRLRPEGHASAENPRIEDEAGLEAENRNHFRVITMADQNTAPDPLADIAHLADAADTAHAEQTAAAQPGGQVAAAAPVPTQADQLAAILLTVGSIGGIRFPSLRTVYTEEKCKAHAEALAPALERLGVTLNHGETMMWMGAAGSVFMMLMETRTAIIHDLKAEQSEQGGKTDAPVPGQVVASAQAADPGKPADGVHAQMGLYK
jgi:hypothetical protein